MKNTIKKVLVVDDEEDLTWSISKNLSRDKDKFEIFCVNSGKEALKILASTDVDLVVSDIRMPEVNGLDLLLEIKDKYAKVKVIIMTAFHTQEYEKVAYDRGCINYIEKPFEISNLRRMILDAIQEKKGFIGQVSDFQISDIIQMNCLGRLTTALFIEKEEVRGIIYFKDGNIIHAIAGDVKGEEAFYKIISWDDGNFSSRKGLLPDEETIFKGWQSLFMEGMRRKDENSDLELNNNEELKKTDKIRFLLQHILDIQGIMYTCLLDSTYKVQLIEKSVNFKDSLKISDFLNDLKENLNKLLNNEFIKLGLCENISLKFSKYFIQLQNIENSSKYLLIFADEKVNQSKLLLELKKSQKEIGKLIE